MSYSTSVSIPENMRTTINSCAAALGAVGLPAGALGPGTDLAVIAPVWAGMTVTLASQAGKSMNQQTAKKLAIAVATGVAGFVLGSKIASTAAGWILAVFTGGASVVLSAVANAALNAKLTHSYGKAIALYFLQTSDLESSEVIVQIVIAIVGLDFGIPTSRADVTA